MKKLILKYEILVSGLYYVPNYEKDGFRLTKNVINHIFFTDCVNRDIIFLNPLTAYCCESVDSPDNVFYMTFNKTVDFETPFEESEELETAAINDYINTLSLFDEIKALEQTLTIQINNKIKFPVMRIKIYENDVYLTEKTNIVKMDFEPLSLNSAERIEANITRQAKRMNMSFSQSSIQDLTARNVVFGRAIAFYYDSFNTIQKETAFLLLMTALETLFNIKPESTKECGYCGLQKYDIAKNVAKYTKTILLGNDKLRQEVFSLYGKRSCLSHGREKETITSNEELKLREYVRKVLLTYWIVCLGFEEPSNHLSVLKYIKTPAFANNLIIKSFHIMLDTENFEQIKEKMEKITGVK